MTATVHHSPVVRYHGTMTNMHGLWHVIDGGGLVLKLRDIYGNTLRCRTASVTLVNLPTFTELRAETLHTMRTDPYAKVDGRVRSWLLSNKMVEANPDRPGLYHLTELGQTVDDAIRPLWYDGQPIALQTTGGSR